MAAVTRRRDARVTGGVDPDAAARAAAGGLPVWASLEEALRAARFDAALIASPPAEHARQARACLTAGLAVVVEKPLALSVADAATVARLAAQVGRPALVAQTFRFLRRTRAVDSAIAAGRLGPLRAGTVVVTRAGSAAAPARWALAEAPLWDVAVHHLDVLRRRLGGPPARVHATRVPAVGAGTVDYVMRLEWAGGPAVLYRHREGLAYFHHLEWIEGDLGALRVADDRVTLVSARHRPRRLRGPRGPDPEAAVLDELAAALRAGRPSSLSAAENLATVAMVEAALRSLRTGQAVAPEAPMPDGGS
jgi:predicted dehydrogenase